MEYIFQTILMVIYLLMEITVSILKYAWPFVFLLILMACIKIIINNKKNPGKKMFLFRNNYKKDYKFELFYNMLKELTFKKEVLKSIHLPNTMILITQSGISLFKMFTDIGIVTGNEVDNSLISTSNGFQNKVKNPLLSYDKEEQYIKKLIPNINVMKYLIVDNSCVFKVSTKIKVVKFNQFFYEISKDNKPLLYDEKQLDDMRRLLEKRK